MFNIDDKPTFTATAEVTAPDGSNSDFSVTFEALDIPEFEGFELGTADGAKAFLVRTVRSVDDIVDNQGEPVPDGEPLRAKLYALPWVRPAMIRAYLTAINKAAVGN